MVSAQLDFSVALMIGIGPALGVMYWSMRRFDIPFTQYRLFDDRRLFGGFAVGMIFGTIAAFVEVNTPAGFAGTLLALIAYWVFDESFKMVWLNRKNYQKRFDTTFYGVSVSVGIAATLVVASVLSNVPTASTSLYTLESMTLLVLFSVSWSLIQADTGVLIGFGASRGEMMWPFVKAIVVRVAHGMVLLAFFLPGVGEPWVLISIVTSIVFALIVYHYAYTVLLPGTLPDDIRRELRREKRRERKAKA